MKIKGFLDSGKWYLSDNVNFWSWLMNQSWPWKSKSYADELMSWNFCRAGTCLLLTRGIPHFAVLLNIALFTNWRFVVILHLAISIIFPPTFARSVSHFSIFLQYFRLFYHFYFCYSDLWSVTFYVIVVVALGYHQWRPYHWW